jgi:heme exporter protein B
LVQQLFWLLKKEFTLEWRQKYSLGGIFLYVGSTIFIIYTSFIKIQPNIWNILFWIIALFTSVNAVAKSFVQESGYRQLYYYQTVNPVLLLLAKMIYNTILLLLINVLSFSLLSIVAGNPVKDYGLFSVAILLGSIGFSFAFTFVSSIASKANNSATLMAILSFPIVIPIIMTLVKIAASALRLLQDTSVWKDIAILFGINLILGTLAIILFPYIWKE